MCGQISAMTVIFQHLVVLIHRVCGWAAASGHWPQSLNHFSFISGSPAVLYSPHSPSQPRCGVPGSWSALSEPLWLTRLTQRGSRWRSVSHPKVTGHRQKYSRVTQSHVQPRVGEEQVTDRGSLELITLGSTLDALVMSGVEMETKFKPFVSSRRICNISGLYFKALYLRS